MVIRINLKTKKPLLKNHLLKKNFKIIIFILIKLFIFNNSEIEKICLKSDLLR